LSLVQLPVQVINIFIHFPLHFLKTLFLWCHFLFHILFIRFLHILLFYCMIAFYDWKFHIYYDYSTVISDDYPDIPSCFLWRTKALKKLFEKTKTYFIGKNSEKLTPFLCFFFIVDTVFVGGLNFSFFSRGGILDRSCSAH
jgi:hypothetical protein